MPHQNKHTTRPIHKEKEIWLAMLDLLPVDQWHDLWQTVRKTHIWWFELTECTTFTVAE